MSHLLCRPSALLPSHRAPCARSRRPCVLDVCNAPAATVISFALLAPLLWTSQVPKPCPSASARTPCLWSYGQTRCVRPSCCAALRSGLKLCCARRCGRGRLKPRPSFVAIAKRAPLMQLCPKGVCPSHSCLVCPHMARACPVLALIPAHDRPQPLPCSILSWCACGCARCSFSTPDAPHALRHSLPAQCAL